MRIRHLLGAAGAAALFMPALAQAQPACAPRAPTIAAKPDVRCVQQGWKGQSGARYAGMGDFHPGTPREYDENHIQGGHYDANGVWADGEPLGYWDAVGAWHPGNLTGYIDARGHWYRGSEPSSN
jgi:hypothetical protein